MATTKGMPGEHGPGRRRRFAALRWISAAAAAIALLAWGWLSGVLSPLLLWPYPAARGHVAPESVLARLVADIDGMAIDGLSVNVSGLTWSRASNTLFTVINNPPAIAELDLDGRLLRHIPLEGALDPEGISHVAGDGFIISDEGDQSVHLVRIGPQTDVVQIGEGMLLQLDFGSRSNRGFEGASWDSRNHRLYLAQESRPIRLLAVDGLLAETGERAPGPVSVTELPLPRWHRLALMDLSSVSRHEASGHLILLSDMSRMILEYDQYWQLLNVFRLAAGANGLRASIPQPEGVTLDGAGRLFVVSEPNLFYRFVPAPAPVGEGAGTAP